MEYLTLNNGKKLPAVGLGLFLATDPNQLEVAINAALEAGYRHFDTAYLYRNEDVLGKVLKEWLSKGKVKREELFITTKLPLHGNRPAHVEHFFNLSLKALQLDYVDLYLVHNPVGVKYVADDEWLPKTADGKIDIDPTTSLEAIWKSMEALVATGKTKSIGISNFSAAQVERIVKVAKIVPVCNQVELNLFYQQPFLHEVCKKNGIVIVAYAPLGSPGRPAFYETIGKKGFTTPNILDDPTVLELAKKYNKSAGQILIRFLVQLGVSTIPKSTSPDRIKQNFQVFDFRIDDSDMNTLKKLDKGLAGRSFTMDAFPGLEKHPEFPFH